MNTEVFEMLASTRLQYGHMIAFQGLDTWRNSYITEGKSFCETTDLSGSVDAELGDRVVNAIASFGVAGIRADSIECGPVVTRVNLVLPRGVRIKTVADLANDLALQLKVASVSFTAVPSKGYLALDIPAANRKTVLPGNVHTANKDGMELPLEIGVTVTGEARAIDLAKAPHLLIAGQTGSGKSVCINSIICSLLRNVKLNDFDLMLVDPKGVELNDYKNVPNVINNQILVNPNDSIDGLNWLVTEMERRYSVLTATGFRNIKSYNAWVKTQDVGMDCVEKMRYIVCVVDEFADLMMNSGSELTAIVQKLAQKSRAVGIHLILATQRPSVKVVTGDLKANLPCRIAFKVSSATDSTTILGHGGAERLLGMGDMILSNNDDDERLHGVYMNDGYIARMANISNYSSISTIRRRVDFVTNKVTVKAGETAVPSWILETMNSCEERRLAVDSPAWLKKVVAIHHEIWDHTNIGGHTFTMAVLVLRAMKQYDKHVGLFDGKHADETSNAFNKTLRTMLRLSKASTLGAGFASKAELVSALRRESPINEDCMYFYDII